MKKLLAIAMAFSFVIMPFAVYGQSEQTITKAPPISQTLVPEGDFALALVTALKLGTATTEAQAEDMLTSAGITPRNGWIADYPMTPIIIGELQSAVLAAAATNKLPIGKEEALKAFQDLTTEFGIALVPGSGQYAESQPPTTSEYVQPSVVNNYYYEEGPPVVTYYPPPWDYYYLYSWVSFPFWCSGFFFPGFFVLNDFDIIAAGHFHGHHHHHLISNHFIDPRTRTALRVDPTTRTIGRAFSHPGNFERQNRNFQRPLTGENRHFSVPFGKGFNRTPERFGRSFSPPSRSFSEPRGSFEGFHGGGFHGGGFHGGGFSGRHR